MEFFDTWATYEKVVAGDYMHHRRFFARIVDDCRERRQPDEALDILDLGCGDAIPVLPLVEQLNVGSYTGADPSEAALKLARQNLSHLQHEVELHDCTMEEALDFLEGPYDLILLSFSLHHLPAAEKLSVLSRCRSLLSKDGAVAVVDVFLDDDESRENYLKRWEQDSRARFIALAPQEIDQLVAHVNESDIPETLDTMRSIATQAGYAEMRLLERGPEKLNGAVIFQQG